MNSFLLSTVLALSTFVGFGGHPTAADAACCSGTACCDNCPTCCADCCKDCGTACCEKQCCGQCPSCCK